MRQGAQALLLGRTVLCDLLQIKLFDQRRAERGQRLGKTACTVGPVEVGNALIQLAIGNPLGQGRNGLKRNSGTADQQPAGQKHHNGTDRKTTQPQITLHCQRQIQLGTDELHQNL